MSGKSLKIFCPPTTKWWPYKTFAKLNGNHLLIASIFKVHVCQTFGLMKMHNMNKIRFANNKFSLWKKFGLRLTGHQKCYFLIFAFLFFQISDDNCQKSYEKTILFYNEFRRFLRSSTTSQMFLIYTFLTMKRRSF